MNSLTKEPGCLSFAVVPDAEVAGRYVFVEVFSDEPAFVAHQASSHFPWWREVTEGVIETRTIIVRGSTLDS